MHRSINYVAGGTVGILIIVIVVMAFQNPLVVVLRGSEKYYAQSTRKTDSITEKDVEAFIREFLEQMFNWEKLAPELIIRQISPFITSGLSERVKQELTQRAEKDFKGKKLTQSIANVRVSVTEKSVVASFDKVLRVEGVPLVIPTELGIDIVRGSETKWNPIGLYVNGIIEHEGVKN